MPNWIPISVALSPLAFTALYFHAVDQAGLFDDPMVASFVLGWVGMAFVRVPWLWVKVLLVVAYPFVMAIGMTLAMVFTHGIPGGPF